MRPFLLLAISWILIQPLMLSGQEATDEAAAPDWLVILSPPPDSLVSGDEPLEISLLIEAGAGLGYRINIDSLDITDDCEIASDYIFYLSARPWPAGRHQLRIVGFLNGDTLLSHVLSFTIAPPQEPLGKAFPIDTTEMSGDSLWEGSVSLGWQYATCSQDTSGLGLIFPAEFLALGEISLYGPLWGGTVNGNLSYDPSYDRLPHGLMQFSESRLEISLGEFIPEMSPLVFYQSLPLGISGRWHNERLILDLAACRTVSSDTIVKTFSQYLIGGRVGLAFSHLSFGCGGIRSFDDPGSLPDSVRYQTTVTVYNDTLFGLSDTLITGDTLHPLENSTYWLWSQGRWHGCDLSLEIARSLTASDTGKDFLGNGFLFSVGLNNQRLPLLVSGSHTTSGFRSFGNPFLEAGKSQLTARVGWNRPARFSLAVEGSLYRLWLDASSPTGYGVTLSWNHRPGKPFGHSLRLDLGHRPYQGYSYDLRSLSASLFGSALGFKSSWNYTFFQSASTRDSRTHNIGWELSRDLLGRFLSLALNYLYSHNQTLDDGSKQERRHLGLRLAGDASARLFYSFQIRLIGNNNSSAEIPSYQQTVWQMRMGYRF